MLPRGGAVESSALNVEAETTGDHDDLVCALALACMVDPARGRARHYPVEAVLPAVWY
jgi:hypothetical protein